MNILILLFIIQSVYSYLTRTQWTSINKIIQNKNTYENTRNKVNYIIFKKYQKKILSDVYKFKIKYNKYLKNVKMIELTQYGYKGLYYYKHLLEKNKIIYLGDTQIQLIKIKNNRIDNNVYEIINQLDPILVKTFYYRFDKDFNVINSIEKVSDLMSWSHETTRKKLNKVKLHLRNNIHII
jgi:hypothetical protein